MGTEPIFVPLPGFREYPEDVMVGRAADFYADMARRRTVRQFSDLGFWKQSVNPNRIEFDHVL